MKRTCEGCKALEMMQYESRCTLGYSFDKAFKPLSQCPKPKTYAELFHSQRKIIKKIMK